MNHTNLTDIINISATSKINNKITENYETYQKLTKSCLINMSRTYNKSYAKFIYYILKNDDLMHDMTTSFIMADIKFDPNKSSRHHWRSKYLSYAISMAARKNKRKPIYLSFQPRSNITAEDEYLEKELLEILTKSINSLNNQESNIAKDYYFDKLTQNDIAKKYSISQPYVNKIIKTRIKPLLQEKLEQYAS